MNAYVTFLASPSRPRTVVHDGETMLAVDTVALVGGIVVKGMLSDGPEYIPFDAIRDAAASLDGRPVVPYHPSSGTANTPHTRERETIGTVFNAEFRNGALQCVAFVSPSRCAAVGDDAVATLADLRAGKEVSVSVGGRAWMSREAGTSPRGESYQYVWQHFEGDHLAIGLQAHGGQGACSLHTHGCGANRQLAAQPGELVMCKCKQPPALPGAYKPLDSWGLGNSQLGLALANPPAVVAALPVAPAYPNHAMRDSWNVRGTQLGRDLGVK